ncbi:hypothetical protein TFKS16_0440 [Tannerella forsythia KS16]|uniref:Uncharacterized protein n=1 Tax=Tannerella forsythia (strain ATCC 43037 / JCM 10827 / CCUG 21028 A / KCTC 5666 / FDC 338) TaxID=203275 RepID=G8ULC1_TANFA|nr:hypothetical protein BFO_0500 [Tannerella forsythia 92A2]BAR50753.1 hypothetical protein TFKS16_0440 [Tannerella forsythia KS16]
MHCLYGDRTSDARIALKLPLSENKTEKTHRTFFHFYLLDVHFPKHPARKFIFFIKTASKI